jgi:DNA-3-methyladenine glycosylase
VTVSKARLRRAAAMPLEKVLSSDVLLATGALVGCVLARRVGNEVRQGLIVETEAYHQSEPGSHSYRGITPRTQVMFGPAGYLYVYFTYGMWHCCNVVAETEGTGAAVLLRAAEPLAPFDGSQPGTPRLRLSGPGLLCQGLELTRDDNAKYLLGGPAHGDVWLYRPEDYKVPELVWSRRVGLGFYEELPWRARWVGHPAVSKGRPTPQR